MTLDALAGEKLLNPNRGTAVIAECRLIAAMTEEPGRITRRFLTPPVAEVHARLRSRMEELGMSVCVDALGNLRGLHRPSDAPAERLILGSHIDSVPNAGAFDGVLGVVLSLEWVRLARELNLPLAIEVIAFSEEEGVRFGIPFFGSRAVTGTFDSGLLTLVDEDGITVEDAIRNFGLDPHQISQAALNESVLGFVEIHIEQGPVLESENLQLAVAEGIVGQSRLTFQFTGHANHAGTTPMNLRRDALAAASEWILSVESAASLRLGLVATVGKISAEPNAGNVIPGKVEVSLDVRHLDDEKRESAVEDLKQAATTIAVRRGVRVQVNENMVQKSVRMDPDIGSSLLSALEEAGYPRKSMASGAGHDAMIMASRVPSAMLFLCSPGGVSHHPDESVRREDVEAAIEVGAIFLQRLSSSQCRTILE